MKKNLINYGIIILYSILLIGILLGENHIYGSEVDWINQHTVIPEFFRNIFYETNNFIPNYIFNLGAGQNIFNYSYYGLMSPIILISYLLPKLSMQSFIIIASIFLYLLSGILIYNFLKSKDTSKKMSLLATLTFQTLSPITFHFHHHIMFVWYFPFLILSLFGIDHYLNKKGSLLLMISIFLLIMTNYYYAVPSLLVIVIYTIYQVLSKNTTLKSFILDCTKVALRVLTPILLAAFLLLPTASSMMTTGRNNNSIHSIKDIILPNIEQILYSSFSIGLTFLILTAPLGLLCQKKLRKNDAFLSISLLICTFCPIIMYILNGLLYSRGKVLIPLLVLYILTLTKFIKNLYHDEINLKRLIFILTITTILFIIINYHSTYIIGLALDAIITFIAIKLFIKRKNISIIYIPLLLTLLVCTISNNKAEIYIQKDQEDTNLTIQKLFNTVKDDTFYRTDTLIDTNKLANKSYKSNYNNTSIYSSTNNKYYWDFYNFEIGNNIEHRNMLNTSGTNNNLFNHLMGVKYLISKKDVGANYQKIASLNNINLYENKNVNPILSITEDYGSLKDYQKLSFPYNLEYLINYPVTNTNITKEYHSSIKKVDLLLNERYKFKLKKPKTIIYNLPQTIENKFLIITFDMNYNSMCIKKKKPPEEKKDLQKVNINKYETGDTSISINGIKNKLTCADWPYHNQNIKFEYIISSNEELTKLKVKLSEGKYDISNINIYTMDNKLPKQKSLDQIKVNKRESSLTATTSTNKTSYVITSLPYDKGFKVLVDNKEVKKELVNKSFLGFKVKKGYHKIKIEYTSPWYNLGKLISKIGIILFIIILSTENINHRMKKKKHQKSISDMY